jgi:hypothetical protein
MAAQAPPPGTPIPRPMPVKPVPPPLNSPEGRAAAKAQAEAQRQAAAQPPRWRRVCAAFVPWLAVAFLAGLLGAMFLAGYGVTEVGGQGMDLHVGFVHLAELFPLLIVLFGFLGADRFSGVLGVVLLVLFGLQYAFIGATEPSVRALHPLNGAVLVGLATMLAVRRPVWRRR